MGWIPDSKRPRRNLKREAEGGREEGGQFASQRRRNLLSVFERDGDVDAHRTTINPAQLTAAAWQITRIPCERERKRDERKNEVSFEPFAVLLQRASIRTHPAGNETGEELSDGKDLN